MNSQILILSVFIFILIIISANCYNKDFNNGSSVEQLIQESREERDYNTNETVATSIAGNCVKFDEEWNIFDSGYPCNNPQGGNIK